MSRTVLEPDAGLSLVELLVGLVILSAMVVVIASALQGHLPAGPSAYDRVAQLLEDTRRESLTSGDAGLLVATATTLKVGKREIAWDRSEGELRLSSPENSEGFRAIVFPDGSLSGPPLRFVTPSGSRLLPGVSRQAASGAQ